MSCPFDDLHPLLKDPFAVCFCFRVRPEVQRAVMEAGIRLIFAHGRLR